eukprot:gene17140-18860_t
MKAWEESRSKVLGGRRQNGSRSTRSRRKVCQPAKSHFQLAKEKTKEELLIARGKGAKVWDRWIGTRMRKYIRKFYGNKKADSFKAIPNWMFSFKKRHGISLRQKTNKKKQGSQEMLPVIQAFHKQFRSDLNSCRRRTNMEALLCGSANLPVDLIEDNTHSNFAYNLQRSRTFLLQLFFGVKDNGWMDSAVGTQWVRNTFAPAIVTDKLQPVDAGEDYMIKKLIGCQMDPYLENDENFERWCGQGFSASERRILLTKLKFGTKISSYSARYGKISRETNAGEKSWTLDPLQNLQSRHLCSKVGYDKEKCFIGNERTSNDGISYNEGGVGRCSDSRAETRLLKQKESFLKEKEHPFYEASCRLDAILKVDKNCYLAYAHRYIPVESTKKDLEEDLVIQSFLLDIKRKIIKEKCAFLLHELLNDIKYMSEQTGFENSVIKDTRALRRHMEKEF